MAKRNKPRANPYGKGVSIFYREDEDRWICAITLPGGKRKQVSGSVGTSFEEMQSKFEEAIRQARRGIASSEQTLSEYTISWIEEKQLAIKRATNHSWKGYMRTYVLDDPLGALRLQDITENDVRDWIMRMINKGLAASTIHLIHSILSLSFKLAVRRKMIGANPCEDVTLPRIEEKEMQFLDPKQARHLLSWLKQKAHPHEALIVLAMTTGMRRGELQALRREDIDFDRGVVHVRRSVVHIPGEGYHENEPKTKGSKRAIPLTPETTKVLLSHCEREGIQSGLVFRGRFGSYFSPRGITDAWERILIKAGLPRIRFHDLRHTAATLMLRAGVSLKSLQRILGHSDIQTTMRYIHLLPEMLEEDIQRFGSMLFAA